MKNLYLSILSGILLSVSWVAIGDLFPLIFIAFVPIFFFLERNSSKSIYFIYKYTYLTMLIFNILTTWWIYFASSIGAIFAIVFNSFIMSLPIILYHFIQKNYNLRIKFIPLIFAFLSIEYLHLRWSLSWPWLNLGNVFANSPKIIQWYQYTGVEGGTLWILIANIIIYYLIKTYITYKKINSKLVIIISLLIILPIVFSLSLYYSYNEKSKDNLDVILTQPNVDPYKKFTEISSFDQLNNIIHLGMNKIVTGEELIIAPETAIPNGIDEERMKDNEDIKFIIENIDKYSDIKLLIGSSSYRLFEKKHSEASYFIERINLFAENYNSAFFLKSNDDSINIYHKSRLVPGVEKMPFQRIFGPLEKFFDLGGTSGTLGIEKKAKNFEINNYNIAPIICYESIYGEYCSEFVNLGANMISISTNDAWWYDTPGYRQLLSLARLRAIENRRWIARSANSGISCFIDPRGMIVQKTNWDEKTSIKNNIPLLTTKTFYSKNGDFIGRVSIFLTIIMLLISLIPLSYMK